MSQSTEAKQNDSKDTHVNTSDSSFVAGSTVEKQAYARHYAQQSVQDIDVMVIHGSINSPEALIDTDIPGFKQIRFEFVQKLGDLSRLSPTRNSNGDLCLNGLEMKKYHTENMADVSIGGALSTVTSQSQTDATAASVAIKQHYDLLPLAKDFSDILFKLSSPEHDFSSDLLKQRFNKLCHGYMEAIGKYALPLLINAHTQKIADEWKLNEQCFSNLLNIVGPAYGYRLPECLKQQFKLILKFYEKHKHLSDSSYLKDTITYLNSCTPNEMDIVPAIQIKDFWPDDIQLFLNRLKKNRPCLYEKLIPKASMHLIAKWPKKTLNQDEEVGFRYSFSALERMLAQERTDNEQILNGIARSIYYRYLKKSKNLIPSYFVKTSVFWMCEKRSELINNIHGNNTESIVQQIAYEWIKFAKRQLSEHRAPHYFIKNINLLEPYGDDVLNQAVEILEEINLQETIELEFMKTRQKMVEDRNRRAEQFLRQIKISDFRCALNDYKQMKNLWPSTINDSNNDNDDFSSFFNILNTLGYLDNENQNWTLFQKLIIESNQEDFDEPIFDEDVLSLNLLEFVENLSSIPYLLKFTYENITKEDFNDGHCPQYNSFDMESFRNVANDLLNPSTMMHNTLATYGTLFTGSLFGINQNKTENILASFFRRNLLQDQGIGPQLNLQTENASNNSNRSSLEDKSYDQQLQKNGQHQGNCPRCSSSNLLDLLNNAPSQEMTFGEYMDLEQTRINKRKEQDEMDEDILSFVLQQSIDDLQNFEQICVSNENQHEIDSEYFLNNKSISPDEKKEVQEENRNLLMIQPNSDLKSLFDTKQNIESTVIQDDEHRIAVDPNQNQSFKLNNTPFETANSFIDPVVADGQLNQAESLNFSIDNLSNNNPEKISIDNNFTFTNQTLTKLNDEEIQ